jgi:uncharacterized ParB-like nuclease family protein
MTTLDDAPPVLVYQQEDKFILVNGYHRVEAAKRLGRDVIRADIEHRPIVQAGTYLDPWVRGGCGHIQT